VAPEEAGRAISPGVAAELTSIMEAVVERGTGSNSRVDGYAVAGKTGTAQKVVDGRYSDTDYNVSFVGFVPSGQPRFTIVVVVDSPRNVPKYGGTVAAPIFQKIASAALRHHGLTPSVDPSPPLLVARGNESRARLAAGPAPRPAIVEISSQSTGATSRFPDLRGLGARDALRVLSRLGLSADLRGDGVVVQQYPAVGGSVVAGEEATVWLRRQMPPAAENDAGP